MKVEITEDCIACGRCVEVCPEVFEMGNELAQARMDEIPPEHQEATREAADECPTNAIVIEE